MYKEALSPHVISSAPHTLTCSLTLSVFSISQSVFSLFRLLPFHRDDILAAVKKQRGTFDEAAGTKRKALESQRLLALLFYTALPPGRAKEFHTLHYRVHDTIHQPTVDPQMPNCLHITGNGKEAYILLGDYKTHKTYGDHFLPLHPNGQLLRHLAVHLNNHRPALVGDNSGTALFLVSPSPLLCTHTHTHTHTVKALTSCDRYFSLTLLPRTKGGRPTRAAPGQATLRASWSATQGKR